MGSAVAKSPWAPTALTSLSNTSRLTKSNADATICEVACRPVFLSYARAESATHARALEFLLGDLAFLDTSTIDDGEQFPDRLVEAVLGARVVVIFATETYLQRRFCRMEMRLALAGSDAETTHVVLALGDECGAVLDLLPPNVANTNWPQAGESDRIEALVRRSLASHPNSVRCVLSADEAHRLVKAVGQESSMPEPFTLAGVPHSLPEGVAQRSIGPRFVGRAADLRRIHRILSSEGLRGARLIGRIAAGAGFGKTRLAVEYVHRYGAKYYPGGVFWVTANARGMDKEFWRVLHDLDPTLPDLRQMRERQRDVRLELAQALRAIDKPALWVIDNILEAAPGEDPLPIGHFCPDLNAVTVLATSRQDTQEPAVQRISVDALTPDSAVLLLTENVPGAGVLTWDEWQRNGRWVGNLPIALDLLNRVLALNSISPRELLKRSESAPTKELDSLRGALRGIVPKDAIAGISEAFSISVERLPDQASAIALLLAQLASAPIPTEFLDELWWDDSNAAAVKAMLTSRHFVTGGGGMSFGVMHPLMADFLRGIASEREDELIAAATASLFRIMTPAAARNRAIGRR